MKVEEIINERLDQLVEAKASKAINMFSSSDGGLQVKANLAGAFELLTQLLGEENSAALYDYQEKNEYYIQLIAECAYSLGLCDALVFAQN